MLQSWRAGTGLHVHRDSFGCSGCHDHLCSAPCDISCSPETMADALHKYSTDRRTSKLWRDIRRNIIPKTQPSVLEKVRQLASKRLDGPSSTTRRFKRPLSKQRWTNCGKGCFCRSRWSIGDFWWIFRERLRRYAACSLCPSTCIRHLSKTQISASDSSKFLNGSLWNCDFRRPVSLEVCGLMLTDGLLSTSQSMYTSACTLSYGYLKKQNSFARCRIFSIYSTSAVTTD